MTEFALKTERLSVRYGNILALSDVSIRIPKGSRCAIVGPNGAGKSTLFKAILGLEPSQGSREILGQSERLDKVIEQSIAYIPQASDVNWQFPATVYDIVMMGRFAKMKGWFKRPNSHDRAIVAEAIQTMALEEFLDRQIDQLSGGQRQRVFIARALAQEADLYLMDEPLAGVDIQTEKIIMDTLKDFQNKGKTSLVIHHDLNSLTSYFDHMVWVNQGVIAAGPIKDVLTTENYQRTYRIEQSIRGLMGFNFKEE
ncbi:metal ABC transporter ATP-binding protein [Streptococcus rifensis]